MSLRIVRAISAALGLLACALPALAEDRALIIGISKYPKLPPHKQLTGPVNDARLMERVAREVWGFAPTQIKLLLDEQATSGAIRSGIETWLIAGTRPGNRVLLYYAGHGYFKRTGNPKEPDGIDETLAPSDVVQVGGSYDNMIIDDEIDAYLQRLKERDVIVIVDACHSGTITRSFDPAAGEGAAIVRSLDHGRMTRGMDAQVEARVVSEEVFGRLRHRKVLTQPHPHVLAISSVSSTELAQEDMELADAGRLGVFTRRFADGLLAGKAASAETGSITVAGLVDHLRRGAFAYCRSYPCRTGMTPSVEAPAAMLARDLKNWQQGSGQPSPSTSPARPRPADFFPVAHASGVRAEILPRPEVRVGDEIKVRVTSEKTGWLIVLDVRDDGRVVQLFPSDCARKERQVRGATSLTLPDAGYGCEFTAMEPGTGQILAIVTEDNVLLDALLARHRDLEIVAEPQAYLAEIAQRLLTVWTGDSRNRPIRWGMAVAHYDIQH